MFNKQFKNFNFLGDSLKMTFWEIFLKHIFKSLERLMKISIYKLIFF
jgi:hypothetical protein